MAIAVRFREAVTLAGRFPLLAGVTCDVAEGEIVHLRGPNGAGKTSFLRCCAGLVPIVSGEAFVLGYDLQTEREDLRREVGLLGLVGSLYDELTVDDNLRFAVKAARRPLEGLDVAIDRMQLSARIRETRVGQLSTGQRRRVALAAFLARAPRLWLLDEPHAGLDASGRDILDELIVEAAHNGATVVLASHELERAAGVSDRDLAMDGGRFIDGAAPEASKEHNDEPTSSLATNKERGRDVA